MARLEMSGLDELMDQMDRMKENTGPVARAMIMAGAREMKEAMKAAAEEHGHRDTGDMIESIGYAKEPTNLGEALAIDIYPQGKDRRGKRNAEKAFILHYGTSKITGSHWVDDAESDGEDMAVQAMKKIWEDYMESGQVPTD